MNNHLRITIGIAALLALAGCQKESAPAFANNTPQTSASAAKPMTETVTRPLITLKPASLMACEPAAVVSVKWDIRGTHSDVSSVEIWAGTKLFAAGGATGEAKTGAWTTPGTHFALKNKADGQLLGEAVEGGPRCH